MLIPLGILAASGGVAVAEPAYELISTTVLGSDTSSVTFSSLGDYSSTYKHLQIRGVARSSRTATNRDDSRIRFNGDTGSNYAYHALEGTGTSVGSYAGSSQTFGLFMFPSTNNDSSDRFSPVVVDILDPYSTSKNTTVRSFNGRIGSSPNLVNLISTLWNNTASVTSITLDNDGGPNWVAGTRFSLYGIKG